MKTILSILSALALFVVAGSAFAQEQLNPIPISGGQTFTQQVGGQLLRLNASGVNAVIYFDVVSPTRIAGLVHRTSGGSTQGNVNITWISGSGITVVLHLSPQLPDQPFSMEGGEGDKKDGGLAP